MRMETVKGHNACYVRLSNNLLENEITLVLKFLSNEEVIRYNTNLSLIENRVSNSFTVNVSNLEIISDTLKLLFIHLLN